MTKKKPAIFVIIGGICAVAAVALILATGLGRESKTWQEYYDLGMQYINEGKYEEAIVAFTSAVKIDGKQAVVYTGRGDAHMGRASQLENETDVIEQFEKAIDDYEKAVELGDSEAEAKLENAQDALKNRENTERYKEQLSALYDLLSAGDTDSAVDLVRQEDYVSLSDTVTSGYLYYDEDGDNGLGIYPDGFYYFGQWENGKRSGHGLWMKVVFDNESVTKKYIFNGEWFDDKPNGQGEEYTVIKRPEDSSDYSYEERIKGMYINGRADGQMTDTISEISGDVISFTATAQNGVYQPIGTMPDGIHQYVASGDDIGYIEYSQDHNVAVLGFLED